MDNVINLSEFRNISSNKDDNQNKVHNSNDIEFWVGINIVIITIKSWEQKQ